jgi:hypothetical protein
MPTEGTVASQQGGDEYVEHRQTQGRFPFWHTCAVCLSIVIHVTMDCFPINCYCLKCEMFATSINSRIIIGQHVWECLMHKIKIYCPHNNGFFFIMHYCINASINYSLMFFLAQHFLCRPPCLILHISKMINNWNTALVINIIFKKNCYSIYAKRMSVAYWM